MELPSGWIILDRARGDLGGQVHRAVRERILAGHVTTGQRLPSTRALAHALGLSRSTIVSAYERLRAEGFLEGQTGSATRVAPVQAPPRPTRRLPTTSQTVLLQPPATMGSLEPGVPDLSAFPHAAWARCLGARARAGRSLDLGYAPASGLDELKAAILAHVSATRGVVATVDQVIVVPSTRSAIDLLARLVLHPDEPGGNVAWIEEPGYPTAQELLRAAGARLVPVPCDAQGIDLVGVAGASPRLIYVTPSHQYPTGATMSLPRRLAVLRAAQASGAVVLEDDYDSEFQYGSRPIAALQGIDRVGCVAYLGTFSKVLAPGLRIAYAILPSRLLDEADAWLRMRGPMVATQLQGALADFLRDGHLRAHARRVGALYRARMAMMVAALERHCGDVLHIGEGSGGLQVAAWFRDTGIEDRSVADALSSQKLGVRPLSDFYVGQPRAGLLFGIARVTPPEADNAARCIRRALSEVGRTARTRADVTDS